MDRVFLDANVLFSAAYSETNRLLKLWQLKRTSLLTWPYAIDEARRNLTDPAQRERLVALAGSLEQIPTLSSQPLTVHLPKKDEPIWRAALAGRATHLLTGDIQHFGTFFDKRIMGILILPPAHHLERRG
jgi:predicted nucleic acid-binding protein